MFLNIADVYVYIQVLEEAGISRKIKRIAGSSVGAITAALLAVGFTSSELEEFMEADLKKVLVGMGYR